jgi:hypothetical protein
LEAGAGSRFQEHGKYGTAYFRCLAVNRHGVEPMLAVAACLDDLVRLLELWHAPLLHSDLHDPAMLVLRLDRRRQL